MTVPSPSFFPFITEDAQYKQVLQNIRNSLSDYIKKFGLKSLVLGISGGIDSALCAAIMAPVCAENNIPLIGKSITIETNKTDEIERANKVGECFCHEFEYLDITDTFLENKKLLVRFDDSTLSKLRQGNMKARMRMMLLYDVAQLNRGIVISTDNYTEFLTGFWTLHGDVGDVAPIMNLWKTEVFGLAKYLLSECNTQQNEALQACIEATPVDGLGISSCDCEQLGVDNYFQADQIFAQYFQGDTSLETHPIIKRYRASEYKRNNPIPFSRELLICNK